MREPTEKEKEIINDFIENISKTTDIDFFQIIAERQIIRYCAFCKYSNHGHCAGTEECHECMFENKCTPSTDRPAGEWKEEVIKKIQDHIQHHDYGDFGIGATMGLMDAIQIIKEIQ